MKKGIRLLYMVLVCVGMLLLDGFVCEMHRVLWGHVSVINNFNDEIKHQFQTYFNIDLPEDAEFEYAELVLIDSNEDRVDLSVKIKPDEIEPLFKDYTFLPVQFISEDAVGHGANGVDVFKKNSREASVFFSIRPQFYDQTELIYSLFEEYGRLPSISPIIVAILALINIIPIGLLASGLFRKEKREQHKPVQ